MMTWFKIDDSFAFHSKAVAAGPALALWVRAGAWSAQQLTDGRIPAHMVPVLGSKKDAERLVTAGLWDFIDGDYYFHDWEDYQPTRAQVHDRRAVRAAAGAKGGRASSKGASKPQANEQANASGLLDTPDNPRPDPTRPLASSEAKKDSTPRRGCRIPDDFAVTTAMRTWAAAEAPNADLDRATEEFIDYWTGLSGAKAVKLDWVATWRNRMREVSDRRGNLRTLPHAANGVLPAGASVNLMPWER